MEFFNNMSGEHKTFSIVVLSLAALLVVLIWCHHDYSTRVAEKAIEAGMEQQREGDVIIWVKR